MVNNKIAQLIQYGITRGLIEPEDKYWALNGILSVLGLDSYEQPEEMHEFETPLQEVLDELVDDAVRRGRVKDDMNSRDIMDSELMAFLTPRPSQVIEKFRTQYSISPQMATEWFYDFSRYTNYIRSSRVMKDIKWVCNTQYGDMDITINLSKPEKDPKAIAAEGRQESHDYPKCQLCREAEGYCGRADYPARANHRLVPVKLNGENYYLQYSPYVYFNEHCIVLNEKHLPAKMDKSILMHLLDFVRQYPHYFIGSNAELPIVGGSILSHDHYQGGRYTFAMERAEVERYIEFKGYGDIDAGILCWPLSVIRLRGRDSGRIADLADKILTAWREYSNESLGIIAKTGEEIHNTITPIVRRRGLDYEMDIVLRNNRCSDEYPYGIFHPHQELHHIKKENIGLIEVMGLAVLPARLKTEMDALAKALVEGSDLYASELTAKHAEWVKELQSRYKFTEGNVKGILRNELGQVFVQVLGQCGVFKRDSEGQTAFRSFLESVQ